MRTVVSNNSMVAHLWANQSQSHAQSGNMSFYGNTIQSYAAVIGRLVNGKGGRKAALLSRRHWSVTTTQHQGIARCAVRSDTTRFYVLDPSESPRECLKRMIDDLARTAKESKSARMQKTRDRATTDFQGRIASIREFAEFFGIKVNLPDDIDADEVIAEADRASERIRKADAKRRKEAEKRQAAERAKNRRIYLERLEKWKEGQDVALPWYGREDNEGHTLRIKGDIVETSGRAEFPIEHARRAFPLIKRCRDQVTTYQHNGHSIHLGAFVVDSVDELGTVKAGCHVVRWEEIERIAGQLGLSS